MRISAPPYGMIHQLRTWRQASPAVVVARARVLRDRLDQHARSPAPGQVGDAGLVPDSCTPRQNGALLPGWTRRAARWSRFGCGSGLGSADRRRRGCSAAGRRRRGRTPGRPCWRQPACASAGAADAAARRSDASGRQASFACAAPAAHRVDVCAIVVLRSARASRNCASQLALSPGVQPGREEWPLPLSSQAGRVGLAFAADGRGLHAARRRPRARHATRAERFSGALMTSCPPARRRPCPASACRRRCPSPRPRCPCRG